MLRLVGIRDRRSVLHFPLCMTGDQARWGAPPRRVPSWRWTSGTPAPRRGLPAASRTHAVPAPQRRCGTRDRRPRPPAPDPRAGVTLARITTSEFAGLRAVVTGGASGIGLATAMMLAERGATVACLDLQPNVPAPLVGVRCDVGDDELGPGRGRRRGRSLRRSGHRRQQRGDRLPGHDRRQPRRGVAAQLRHQRARHRPRDAGRPRRPARIRPRGDRQHVLDRGDRRAAASARATRPRRARCWRSRGRWRPTTCAKASASTASTPARPTHRGSSGCSTGPTTRRPSGPR